MHRLASSSREAQVEDNLRALAEDLASRRPRWESRPAIVEYAPNSACNLRCPMCAQSDPARRVTATPRATRRRVYDELLPTTTVLKPFSLSEPLINDLEELAPLLAEHGVALDVVTNACLLTSRNLELLLPHLHRITFSVDSHVPEIFERVRPPARFAQVDANIRHAMPHLRAAGVETRINMVLVRDALPHLEDFVDYLVDEYGCEYLDVLELVPYMGQAADMDPFVDPGAEATGHALERMLARADERGLNVDLIVREPYAGCRVRTPTPAPDTPAGRFERAHLEIRRDHPGFCEQAMVYLKVNPDGETYPCCKAPPELRLGNVFAEGLDEVWNGGPARNLRRRMFRGDYPEPCRDCLFFGFSRSTGGFDRLPEGTWGARLARCLDDGHLLREVMRTGGRWLGLPRIVDPVLRWIALTGS